MIARRFPQHGQAALEYLLVAMLVAAAFGLGREGVIEQLVSVIAAHYQRFTWSISLP